jgi:hypothetical protein
VRDDKKFYDFILLFFRIQSILYTRIGIDELEDLSKNQTILIKDYFASIDKESNKSQEVNKIIHVCITMIFIAHATITEGTKEFIKH